MFSDESTFHVKVEFTDTVTRSGVLKIPTLLGSTYATVQKLTCLFVSVHKRVTGLFLFPVSNYQ